MRKILQAMLLGFALLPALTWADLVNFSIDKAIYQNLDSNQQQAIAVRVGELNNFFKNDVYPRIPAPILEKLKDVQVTINFSDKGNRDGLFVPGSEDHKHKIIVQLIQINSNGIKSLLAHEFFHAIHFEINPDEATWVREGMAQTFEYIVTNELNGLNLQAAIANPYTPLIGTYNIDDVNAAQYGHNMLYFYYLYRHCGGDNFFWSLASGEDDLKGAYLIDALLVSQASKTTTHSECKNFLSSAISFEVAKMHNQTQFTKDIDGDKYFLAPTNVSPRGLTFNSPAELQDTITELPLYSSLRLRVETWDDLKGQCPNCMIAFAKRSFPYDVNEERPVNNPKNYDVILVKIKENQVLTEVSSKNTRK